MTIETAAAALAAACCEPSIVRALFAGTALEGLPPDQAYTSGGCGVAAAAIAAVTGLPLFAVVGGGEPLHAVLRLGDGRLLDALGLHTERPLRAVWGEIAGRPVRGIAVVPFDTPLLRHFLIADPNGSDRARRLLTEHLIARLPGAACRTLADAR